MRKKFAYEIVTNVRLGGGTGRRTGLKITLKRVFNNMQDLPKSTENNVQTHD